MIIMIICAVCFVLGFVLYMFTDEEFFAYLCAGAVIALVFLGLCCIICHVGVQNRIAKYQLTYESLLYKVELLDSETEDISKVEVITEINAWNQKVMDMKYWGYNPWTNWFFENRDVVDSLELIELPDLTMSQH